MKLYITLYINKIIDFTGTEEFSVDQIDIAHRTLIKHFALTIILFNRKQN